MVGDYFLYCMCQSFTTVERQRGIGGLVKDFGLHPKSSGKLLKGFLMYVEESIGLDLFLKIALTSR